MVLSITYVSHHFVGCFVSHRCEITANITELITEWQVLCILSRNYQS